MVRAGEHRALVSASQVEAFVENAPLRRAEGTPGAAGLASVGGRSLIAVDLARVLGSGDVRPAAPSSSLLVFAGPAAVALVVEGVAPAPQPELLGDLGSDRDGQARGRAGNGHDGAALLARVGTDLLPLLRVEQVTAALGLSASFPGDDRPETSRQLAAMEVRLDRRGFHLCERLRGRARGWLASAARELGLSGRQLFPDVLGGDPGSLCAMLEAAVTLETYFFRHPEQFRALRRLLFGGGDVERPLRLWSAGCSSGEEPLGLATLLLSTGRGAGGDRILATDLSEAALAHAREGRFGRWSVRGVAPDLEPLLASHPGVFQLPAAVRQAVEWCRHDLRDPAPEEGFDAVLCRNVLGFLDPEDVEPALRRLLAAVRPGGYLVLSPAELPLGTSLEVERVESEGAVLLRRPWARAATGVTAPRIEAAR